MQRNERLSLVWTLMQAKSESELSSLMSAWSQSTDCRHPDEEVARHLADGDWEAAKIVLVRRYGRYHPRHKPLLDVLMAATQSRRLLKAREAQATRDARSLSERSWL